MQYFKSGRIVIPIPLNPLQSSWLDCAGDGDDIQLVMSEFKLDHI